MSGFNRVTEADLAFFRKNLFEGTARPPLLRAHVGEGLRLGMVAIRRVYRKIRLFQRL